jgi:hypothetical protein
MHAPCINNLWYKTQQIAPTTDPPFVSVREVVAYARIMLQDHLPTLGSVRIPCVKYEVMLWMYDGGVYQGLQ